jgi:hypothetical protein
MSGEMLRIAVQSTYGVLCATVVIGFLWYGRMPSDASWFELSQVVLPALCLISVLSLLAPPRVRYFILAVCAGCLTASAIWEAVSVARLTVAGGYNPSAQELLLYLILILIPVGMCLLAIGRCKTQHI